VIVAEEVKTAEQGEVIGLFIEEKIPRGMTLAETIAAIRAQGGLVYVPHPFDRLHSVPDYEHLLAVVEDIDALEVFNPRVAISAFNEEAVRFSARCGSACATSMARRSSSSRCATPTSSASRSRCSTSRR
jgi:predicted metal-dependent phosphoesterase TrpH